MADAEDDERYGVLTTVDGETIVYDRENESAWIQSDYAVEVGPAEEEATA